MLEDLFLQHGLGNATQVLLTGDSAGGVGAMNNADWIGSVLRYTVLVHGSLRTSTVLSCVPKRACWARNWVQYFTQPINANVIPNTV